MQPQTQNILDQIAEIIRRVGKRDEVEEEIIQNVSFSELVSDQIKVDGPVRDMATKAVVTYLKDLEIEADSDPATEILEAIDFKKFIPTLLQNKEFQESLGTAVENLVENGDLDLSSTLGEAIGDEELKKILNTPSMQEVIADKVKSYVEDFDMSNMEDDFYEKLYDTVFSMERIEAAIKDNAEPVNDIIIKAIKDRLDAEDDCNPVAAAIGESKIFQAAVDKAIADLVDTGKIARLVEKVAADMLSGNESELRSKLSGAISNQLVTRIADSIVQQAFNK